MALVRVARARQILGEEAFPSDWALYEAAKRNRVPSVRIGRKVLFSEEQLRKLASGATTNSAGSCDDQLDTTRSPLDADQ